VCIRAATAKDNKLSIKQFLPWLAFGQNEREKAIATTSFRERVNLPFVDGHPEESLALPSDILGTVLQECDAESVVVQLRKRLQLDRSSLKKPDLETKGWIRSLAREAKLSGRPGVVKYLRNIVPAGTTGPLLDNLLDVQEIPGPQRTDLAIHLCGGEEWKMVAEKIGFDQAYIRCFDKRYRNPVEAVFSCCDLTVGQLYDILVECGLPVLADFL